MGCVERWVKLGITAAQCLAMADAPGMLPARWTFACQGSKFFASRRRSGDVMASEHGGAEIAAVIEGDKFQMERCFTTADVAAYAQLCGDANPIHTSESAARSAGFKGCVVHGVLYAGLFPAIIGSRFAGAVYVSQTLQFRAPVLVGEPVCAEAEVTSIRKIRQQYRVTFATHCYKTGETQPLLGGEAVALLPSLQPSVSSLPRHMRNVKQVIFVLNPHLLDSSMLLPLRQVASIFK